MTEEEIYVAMLSFKIWNDNVRETIFVFPNMSREEMIDRFDEDTPGQIFVHMKNLETRAFRRGRAPRRLGQCNWVWARDRRGEPVELRQAHITLHKGIEWEKIMFVVMHEAGHALGLMHDSNKKSIMYSYPLSSNMEIEQQDIEYIRNQIAIVRRNEVVIPFFQSADPQVSATLHNENQSSETLQTK